MEKVIYSEKEQQALDLLGTLFSENGKTAGLGELLEHAFFIRKKEEQWEVAYRYGGFTFQSHRYARMEDAAADLVAILFIGDPHRREYEIKIEEGIRALEIPSCETVTAQ